MSSSHCAYRSLPRVCRRASCGRAGRRCHAHRPSSDCDTTVAARGGSAADAPQTHATMSTTGTGRRAGAGCCCCCWGRTVAAWFLLTTVISTLNELGRCFFGVARLGEIAAGLCYYGAPEKTCCRNTLTLRGTYSFTFTSGIKIFLQHVFFGAPYGSR